MRPAPGIQDGWPSRLADAATALRVAVPPSRNGARAALWPVLHAALFAALRSQAGRIAPVSQEDLEDLAARLGTTPRSLQRFCAEWIGVGPKELVRWARLHEAAGRAAAGPVDWAELAAELGYADQAHLVRDFSRVVGEPPARYARAQQQG